MSEASRQAAGLEADQAVAPPGARAVGTGLRGDLSPSAVLALQRAAGNRATRAWLERERRVARVPEEEVDTAVVETAADVDAEGAAKKPKGPFNLTDKCVAPMALGGPLYRDAWGILAHAFISSDYEDQVGIKRGRDLYLDDSFAGPIDPAYAAFLIRKNPSLPAWVKVALAITSIKRADAVLHDKTRQEVEEFKPDNLLGIVAGEAKLLAIEAYISLFGLPYVRGTTYTPTPMTRIFTIGLLGVPIELWLKVRRDRDGLIVYKYCIRTDWGLLAWGAVIAAIILAIWLILKGRVPQPNPPDSPTPELPPPNPIPIPVPPIPVPVPVPGFPF